MQSISTSFDELFERCQILPVIALPDPKDAVPLARALVSGNISVLEVTLRTAKALESIERIVAEVEHVIVGAGTVTYPQQLDQIKKIGARFAVTPGFHSELHKAVSASQLVCLPGVGSVSEAMQVRDWGYSHAKLFPADIVGGTAWLRAIRPVLPNLKFCPTGGIRADNMGDYLRLDNVASIGGSWVCPEKLIKTKNWSEIGALARQATILAEQIREMRAAGR